MPRSTPQTRARLDPQQAERARRALARRDPVLGAVIRRVGPCGLSPQGDPYRFLVRAVVFQQLAGAAARAILGRVQSHFGGRIPAPERLAAARDPELRALGLSRQKIAAIRSIAEAFARREIDPRRLHRLDDEGVVEALTRLRGVGEWTAHMVLMSSLGRPDVLPVGDYGVRKGVAALYRLRDLPKRAELEEIAAPWRPWRSVASWYVWRSLDTEP
jgi:DNA-3-methyladenine glycosylase II